MLREVGAVHARGGSLPEAFVAAHGALVEDFGRWPIFEHCMPFDVARLWDEFEGQSREPEDLYALGAVAYLLLAGRPPDTPAPAPLGKLRKGVPAAALSVVAELLDPDPARRPPAREAALRLEAAAAVRASG
jgi:hypothetical protein